MVINKRPRFDFIYLLIVLGIIFLIIQFDTLDTVTLITYLAFFDIILGFAFILIGFIKWDMSYIVAGAFCALCSFYSYKEMSDSSLFFLILGGLAGVGNHVRKTFKNLLG